MINNIPPEKIEILEKEIEQALRNKKFSLKQNINVMDYKKFSFELK